MKKLLFLVVTVLFAMPSLYAAETCAAKWKRLFPKNIEARYQALANKCDGELKSAMGTLISTNTNSSYDGARKFMYPMDRNADGKLCSVYNEICINYTSGNPSSFNCEHSWPQSKGAVGVAKADLHHLYSVDSKTNSIRGNLPFCETANGSATEFQSFLGKDSEGSNCFEPKGEHKGALARSMFYFAIRYRKAIDPKQEAFFRDWNTRETTDTEKSRNDKIEAFQHNRNPFVDHPEFVELISDF